MEPLREKEELKQKRNEALYRTGGVIAQEALNNVLPGAAPFIAGAGTAINTLAFDISEDDEENGEHVSRKEKAVANGVTNTMQEAVLSTIADNTQCIMQ